MIGGNMVFYSAGSGLGATAATVLHGIGGWTAVCLLGLAFSLAALAVWTLWARRPACSPSAAR